MNENIMKDLNKIFIEVFVDPEISITDATTSSDIKKWDSINNMHLIVAIEDHYDIRFELKEIQSLQSVGELCSCVERYLGNKTNI